MLALLLTSTAFTAPTGRPCFGAHAPCRVERLVAQSSAEDAAKAAWLARLDAPSWGGGLASSTSTFPGGTDAPSSGWLMPGAPVLTLEAADEMSNVALREASLRGFNPVSVCVMDAGGRVIVAKTMIGCAKLTPDLAVSKASACIGLHCSSRELRDKYVNADGIGPKMPQLLAFGTVAAAANQAIGPFPGGVLCRDAAGNVIGAIGVSGAASDEDEHCAILAAHSVGLATEPAWSQLS
jgi:uncharacterized protein GlcG (DUF336 family)